MPNRRFSAWCRRLLAVACFAPLAHALAQAPDDAREDRWAQEVEPQVVVGDVVWLSTAQRAKVLAIYTDAPARKGAVLIVHGLGVHPDWGLNGALRTKLAEAGFATLSVQMPVLEAGATREQYRPLYGIAGDRIAAAILELHRRGLTRVAIVAHSVGASMVAAYLARPDALPVAAWVPVGMLVDFAKLPREPVLDIIAGNDFPEVRDSSKVRAARLPADRCSRLVTIPGTDHYFEDSTGALAGAIAPFLTSVFAGQC